VELEEAPCDDPPTARPPGADSGSRLCHLASRYHYEPETNGCVEKFIQTLKEQVLWIERFDTLEQLRARIRQFARDYNEHWLLERHGYRTPRQARDALRQAAMA
jgi:transposase InsO family protein